jgi:hypothetical protein
MPMGKRTYITLTFSADLDPVPGAFDNVEDWKRFVMQTLASGPSSYDRKVEFLSVSEEPYVWRDNIGRCGGYVLRSQLPWYVRVGLWFKDAVRIFGESSFPFGSAL